MGICAGAFVSPRRCTLGVLAMAEIDGYTELSQLSRKVHELEQHLHASCSEITAGISEIKEAHQDHLDTINENTQEIEATSDQVHEIETKLDKLNLRMDAMHMVLKQLVFEHRLSVQLNLNEQKLFSLLCAHKNYLKMEYVVERLRLSDVIVKELVTALMDKGIPVVRKEHGGGSFLHMDPAFSQLQQQQGMIKISPAVHQQFANQQLEAFFG